ncbi:MAG: integration host factor subunit alpha [Alphaproteobacteria bacterium]|nr:integration host factor subunit alpha [Alphaproteobacteria bacterium]
MKTITRADIAEKIYEEIGMSRKECNEILDSIMAEIGDCLASGHDVKLSSFGSFLLKHKTPRIGRNPKTGVEAEISERTVISFKPSQRLRKALNK